MPAVTLRDVARAAGVSTASASRALSRSDIVSPELRDRVLAAARRLHYVVNAAGRSLASQRSRLIGAIVTRLTDPIVAQALTAFEDSLAAAGYALLVATTNGAEGRAADRAHTLIGRGVEALIVAGIGAEELAGAFAGHPELCVRLDAGRPGARDEPAGTTLAQDGVALAARYLLQHGHRRFGIIASISVGAAVRDAVAGGAATLAEERPDTASVDSARQAARRMLTRTPRPTAVLCDSDAVAATMLHECLALGVGVPEEISVTGFGDGELARYTTPALTSVRIAAVEIGRSAAEALLARLRGDAVVLTAQPVKLVVRESTGAAPR